MSNQAEDFIPLEQDKSKNDLVKKLVSERIRVEELLYQQKKDCQKIESLENKVVERDSLIEHLHTEIKAARNEIEFLQEEVIQSKREADSYHREFERRKRQREFDIEQSRAKRQRKYDGIYRGCPVWIIKEKFPYLAHVDFSTLPKHFKLTICRENREKGFCKYGKSCIFSHSPEETNFFRLLSNPTERPQYQKY